MSAAWLDELAWDKDGLIPAIAQDAETGEVLMFAWMMVPALVVASILLYHVWERPAQRFLNRAPPSTRESPEGVMRRP